MMIILEAGIKYHGFGSYYSIVSGKKFNRWWFGFVAITITEYDLKGLHDKIAGGMTFWDSPK